ncbi:WXG100 family type VII secretion target [Glycomyces tenuis]|uniref:WXG100 family type VII secretion target n=1 Tax=Glycomyces tenuis TaxID=58116 RepID=UPI00041C93E5|nr:WXG100 family type VII secretion target [Glycomyces tenuis]
MSTIKLSYSELEAATAQIASESGAINDTLSELASRLDALNWEGSDKEAYEGQRAEWNQSIGKLNEILEQVGTAVNNAKIRYAETEAANAARFAS